MISQDLHYDFYHEEHATSAIRERVPAKWDVNKFIDEYNRAGGVPPWAALKRKRYERVVVQCPSLCSIVHRWAGIDGLAVVMMLRSVDDIVRSQARVGWGFEEWEKKSYPEQDMPISRIKYAFWKSTQKKVLGDQGFEIQYESLAAHPLWVPKAQRKDFATRQLKIGEVAGQVKQLGGEELGRKKGESARQ